MATPLRTYCYLYLSTSIFPHHRRSVYPYTGPWHLEPGIWHLESGTRDNAFIPYPPIPLHPFPPERGKHPLNLPSPAFILRW